VREGTHIPEASRVTATTLLLLAFLEGAMAESGPASRDEAVQIAKRTLSAALAVRESEIRLDDAAASSWPDASLGCPEPDMAYAQVVTPGYRVALRVGPKRHVVHVAGERAVVCPANAGEASPRQPEAPSGGADSVFRRARRDLVARLGVPEAEVQTRSVKTTTWPDTSLGCPAAGQTYEQRPTKGYVIELKHRSKIYRYHADTTRFVACDKQPPS
jgi:hypothetical protein